MSEAAGPGAPSALSRALLAAAIAAILALSWRYMDALGDTFWTLATGRLALASVSPEHDPFAFTAARVPYEPLMPLTGPLFALVERSVGLYGLLVVGALLVTLAWLLVLLVHARRDTRLLLVIPVLGALYLQRDDLAMRGQVFGDLCFALMLAALLRTPESASRLVRFGAPLALGAAWINLHPSALLGVVLPLACAFGAFLEPEGSGRARSYLAFCGLFLAATALNPRGPLLPLSHARLLTSESTRSIELFRSPDFHRPDVLALFALAAVVLLLELTKPVRGYLVRATLLLVLLAAALVGRRYCPLLGMTLVACLGQLGSDTRFAAGQPALRTVVGGLLAVGLLVTTVSSAWPSKDPLAHVPVSGAKALEHRSEARVLSYYPWGGYLDAAWGPQGRLFIDGRNELFDQTGVFEDYLHLAALAPDWPWILDAYRIDAVLWPRGDALERALGTSVGWQELMRGELEVAYVRRSIARP